MKSRHLLALVFAALLLAVPLPAAAQSCSFSMPTIDFGTVDLTQNINFNTSATFQITCTGISNGRVRVCPHFGSGSGGVAAGGNPRRMLNGTNRLNFNIYRNAGFSQVWGSNYWGQPPTPPNIVVDLNAAGTGTETFTANARIPAGQTTLPLGLYQSSFAGGHTLIAYAYTSVGNNCTAIGTSNATQVPFVVRAVNNGTCTVSATTLDFGQRGVLDAANDASNQVSVTCTNGVPYTVGLNGGLANAADPTQRRMTFGAGSITYGIYRDAGRTQPWGDTIGTNTVAGTGNGAAQLIDGYGRVPAQTTPAPGIYTDTVVVTVTY